MQVIPVALGPSEGKPCQLGRRLAFAPSAAPPAPFLVKHCFGAAAAAVHGSPRLAAAAGAAAAASSVPRCSGSAALSSSSSYSSSCCCSNCSSGVAYLVLRCGSGRGLGCAGGRHYCTWRLAATAWGRTPETSAVAAGQLTRGPAAVGAGAFGAALDGAAADPQPQRRRGSGELRRPLSAAVSPAAPSRLDPPIAATLGAAAEPLPPSPVGAWASASDASVSQRTGEGSRAMEARMEGDLICGGGGSCGGAGAGGAWPPAEERLAALTERLRALPREDHPPVSGRAAAVLVGLFEDRSGVVRVLLTQRSAKLKSHRGEVCLPGGKRDEGDEDEVATALREAQEELGLDPARVTVLCSLPPVLSKHHLSVTPVLALLPPDLVPRPNPHEVAAAFTVPLVVFLGQFTDPRASIGGAAGADGPRLTAGSAGGGGGRKAAGRRTRQRPSASVDDEDQRPKALSWLATEEEDEGAAEGGGGGGAGGAASARGTSRRIGRCIGEDTAFEGVEHVFRDIRWGEHQYRIHSFQYGEFDVWGLTATICIDAARLALGRGARFQERCPGGHHYSAFYWDGAALRVRPCASTAPRALLTGSTAAAVEAARVTAAVEDRADALEAAKIVGATAGRTQQAPASATG